MSATVVRQRLETAAWCHVSPVSIPLGHVPVDSDRFPAAAEGFEDFSMAPVVGWSGGCYHLVDISGLVRKEVQQRLKDELYADLEIEAIRFLQALEYFAGCEQVPFERVVAYAVGAAPVVAIRAKNGGFARIPYPGDEQAWPSGTLGLFFIDSL